jgi:hypothetical protein
MIPFGFEIRPAGISKESMGRFNFWVKAAISRGGQNPMGGGKGPPALPAQENSWHLHVQISWASKS